MYIFLDLVFHILQHGSINYTSGTGRTSFTINTTRRTLLLPAGLLQPAATYVFAFTAYVAR